MLTNSKPLLTANEYCGVVPINKPWGATAFTLVKQLRRHLKIKKIGHAGTLDPLATGVMVMLIGKEFTKLSTLFLNQDKEYVATIALGSSTSTYDAEGAVTASSTIIPEEAAVLEAIHSFFQGEIEQIPPMYSAKKINGQKLCNLARAGITLERKPQKVRVATDMLSYSYPLVTLRVTCSKGTYIRTLAHDLGEKLGCCAHLHSLIRTRSGTFTLDDCFDGSKLQQETIDREAFKTWIRYTL